MECGVIIIEKKETICHSGLINVKFAVTEEKKKDILTGWST